MSSPPWPSTPIMRCKKRVKLDTLLQNTLINDEQKENIDFIEGERMSFDQELQFDFEPISDKENQMIDPSISFKVNEIHPGTSETRPKCIISFAQRSQNNESHYGHSVQARNKQPPKSLRYCQSDSYLSPMWPIIKVDKLAAWLRNSNFFSVVGSSTHQDSPQITGSLHPSEFPEHMIYEPLTLSSLSSSLSSLSSCSSSCSGSLSSDEENHPPVEASRFSCLSRIRHSCDKSTVENRKSSTDKQKHGKRRILIVDCRYPYEYEGGHIIGAINLAEWPKLRQFLFGNENSCLEANRPGLDVEQPRASRTVLILHCEFSSHRAPRMFRLLRDHDRLVHLMHYPALRYPRVYVLHGGYAAFYARYPEFCVPSAYRKMHSEPELLSKWHRHCNLVNQKDIPQKLHHNPNPSHRSPSNHIPFLSLNNLPQS